MAQEVHILSLLLGQRDLVDPGHPANETMHVLTGILEMYMFLDTIHHFLKHCYVVGQLRLLTFVPIIERPGSPGKP